MPLIEQFENNPIASFLRRGLYAEALACATESQSRLLPIPEGVTESDITLLISVLLLKCAAHVHLRRYRDSRLSATKANQIAGVYGRRTPEFEHEYSVLARCLKDLEDVATIGGFLDTWGTEQIENEQYGRDLETAVEMHHRSEAEFVDLAILLTQRLGELTLE